MGGAPAAEGNGFSNSSLPSMMTFRTEVRNSNGSPSKMTRSASFPGSMVPILPARSTASAAFMVIDLRASSSVIP